MRRFILLCGLVVACALAAFAQLTSSPRNDNEEVIKIIRVTTRPELLTDIESSGNPLSTLREFIPPGVKIVMPLPSAHGLLVKAASEEDIDQFEQLVKLIDLPPIQVVLRLQLVKMTLADEQFLAKAVVAAAKADMKTREKHDLVREALQRLLATGRATVVSAPVLTLLDGGEGIIALPKDAFVMPLMQVRLTACSDRSIVLTISTARTGALPATLRAQDGRTVVLASGLPPMKGQPAKDHIEGVLVVTPTIVVPERVDYPLGIQF